MISDFETDSKIQHPALISRVNIVNHPPIYWNLSATPLHSGQKLEKEKGKLSNIQRAFV
jgi:hypothetical protein